MAKFYSRYKEMLLYLVFGVLTTCVNFVAYFLLTRYVLLGDTLSTALAWLISVLFAYVTNRRFVFTNKAKGQKEVAKECFSFFASRSFTGLLDVLNMYLFVSVLHLNDLVIKILSNVVIVILNYVLSKFIVFRKKGENANS